MKIHVFVLPDTGFNLMLRPVGSPAAKITGRGVSCVRVVCIGECSLEGAPVSSGTPWLVDSGRPS